MFGDLWAISAHNAVRCQLLDIGGDSVSGRAPKVGALIVWELPLFADRQEDLRLLPAWEAPADQKLLLSQRLICCLTAF